MVGDESIFKPENNSVAAQPNSEPKKTGEGGWDENRALLGIIRQSLEINLKHLERPGIVDRITHEEHNQIYEQITNLNHIISVVNAKAEKRLWGEQSVNEVSG